MYIQIIGRNLSQGDFGAQTTAPTAISKNKKLKIILKFISKLHSLFGKEDMP